MSSAKCATRGEGHRVKIRRLEAGASPFAGMPSEKCLPIQFPYLDYFVEVGCKAGERNFKCEAASGSRDRRVGEDILITVLPYYMFNPRPLLQFALRVSACGKCHVPADP
jgi:hypothetical protein